MSNLILILGESGTGKSTSLETLNPKETFLLQMVNKPLPFKGFKQKYPLYDGEKGNRYVCSNYEKLISCLRYLNARTDIHTIVFDDFQYLLSTEFMKRAKEKGFEKFTEMAQHYYQVIETAQQLREDINIIFLSHNEQREDGKSKIKTVGKLLDEKITIEGLFTVVLNTAIEDRNYYFETQNNGMNTTKSPKGMFEEYRIPNDMQYVITKVNQYYGG